MPADAVRADSLTTRTLPSSRISWIDPFANWTRRADRSSRTRDCRSSLQRRQDRLLTGGDVDLDHVCRQRFDGVQYAVGVELDRRVDALGVVGDRRQLARLRVGADDGALGPPRRIDEAVRAEVHPVEPARFGRDDARRRRPGGVDLEQAVTEEVGPDEESAVVAEGDRVRAGSDGEAFLAQRAVRVDDADLAVDDVGEVDRAVGGDGDVVSRGDVAGVVLQRLARVGVDDEDAAADRRDPEPVLPVEEHAVRPPRSRRPPQAERPVRVVPRWLSAPR